MCAVPPSWSTRLYDVRASVTASTTLGRDTSPVNGGIPDNGGAPMTDPQTKKGTGALATFLIDLSPDDMQHRLHDALTVYVDAMRYPRGTESQRASMWLEHTRRQGWKAVAAVETDGRRRAHAGAEALEALAAARHRLRLLRCAGSMVATAGGRRFAPRRMPADEINRLMGSYFELTELHIHPEAQGRGLGEALARRLLAGRGEANVLLSTPEINGEANRAWRLYRRLGFADVIRGYHFAGDPRAFAILGRACRCNQLASQIRRVWHDTHVRVRSRRAAPARAGAVAAVRGAAGGRLRSGARLDHGVTR